MTLLLGIFCWIISKFAPPDKQEPARFRLFEYVQAEGDGWIACDECGKNVRGALAIPSAGIQVCLSCLRRAEAFLADEESRAFVELDRWP